MSRSTYHNYGSGALNAHTGSGDQYNNITLSQGPAPIYAIPYSRNEDVVHREDLVNKLDELLPLSTQPHCAALYGLGGSGKTQVALQFAYDRDKQDEHSRHSIFWVHADNEATFTCDYKEIAKKLGIGAEVDGEDLMKAVRNGIETRPPWLLVLDNADDLALFGVEPGEKSGKRDLQEYIPKALGGAVLWTSRDARISGTLVGRQRAIEVPSMTVDEARNLLATTGDEGSSGEAMMGDALLEELQYFPLAISQAGAYMHQTSTTVDEYLTLLKRSQDRWSVLKDSRFDRHRQRGIPNSVLETWKISIERIRQENGMAYRILHAIAYLDSQNLSLELIKAVCRHGTTSTTESSEDLTGTRMAVTRLKQFAFLKEYAATGNGRIYEIHKLVQEATRYGLSMRGDEEAQYASLAVRTVSDLFPVTSHDTWDVCEKYLMHAIRVGEWAELCRKQIEVSGLLSRVSGFLYDQGRSREREPIVQRALGIRRMVLGEKHPDTIWCIADLGSAYQHLGRYSEAESTKREALALRREVLGEKHPDTIDSIASLAATCGTRGRYNESEPLHQEALDLRREILGEKHLDTIWSISSLATTYREQGRYSEARPLHQETLDLRLGILGENHLDTMYSMADLATTYRHLGHYNESEGLNVRSLALRRKVLGQKHPHTIGGMAGLAATYHAQGRYSKAEVIYVQALDFAREVLGERHPFTIMQMANLATTYRQQSRYRKAETMYIEAFDLGRVVRGEKHPLMIMHMANLATNYRQLSAYGKAERIYMQALDLGREVVGERHPHTITCIANLAIMYHQQGRYHEAEPLCQRALDLRREILGDKHPDTIQSTAELATIQRDLNISTPQRSSVEVSTSMEAQEESYFTSLKKIVEGKLWWWGNEY
ncbi:hypothetical protein AK830_g4365 [Neonectria ditissima]|uniref:NB-ARC domain-containing protein n=1 Tax=Neonectria ditissima TaxID=78410 RepID=A0A0P7BLI8_9HYPO|nr:hypothetical protein AK830_g4365 [Neonectria ditissima]